MRWRRVAVRGPSMSPALHDGDVVLARFAAPVRPGRRGAGALAGPARAAVGEARGARRRRRVVGARATTRSAPPTPASSARRRSLAVVRARLWPRPRRIRRALIPLPSLSSQFPHTVARRTRHGRRAKRVASSPGERAQWRSQTERGSCEARSERPRRCDRSIRSVPDSPTSAGPRHPAATPGGAVRHRVRLTPASLRCTGERPPEKRPRPPAPKERPAMTIDATLPGTTLPGTTLPATTPRRCPMLPRPPTRSSPRTSAASSPPA